MEIEKKLYEKYMREMSLQHKDNMFSYDEFTEFLKEELQGMNRVDVCQSSFEGSLFYSCEEEEGQLICTVPVYGCYASEEKAAVKLFMSLSEKLVEEKDTLFQMRFYAHDIEMIQTYMMMEFGMMAETGILKKDLHKERSSSYRIRELSIEERTNRWEEIWSMISSIVSHLQKAPVFYPGNEFTEEVYRDFFLDDAVHLYVACDENDCFIGMIETNPENCKMINSISANIGEAYVKEEYRSKGLSDALFTYALHEEKERGTETLWVEHGTANPNARGFWGRYFDTCEYEMDRFIKKVK